ncbi:MAG: DUF2911 domain-containing protein [Bacteroidota bacterium]
MKISLPFIILLFFLIYNLHGQERLIFDPKLSPFQRTETKIGVVEVVLEYSRPSMSGRKIFGHLVPYDQVWRTGANINTKITFRNKILIGSNEVDAGTYTIFTKPGKEEWQVIIYKELNQFGVPDTLKTENIAARISIVPIKLERSIETLTINFDDLTTNSATLGIAWENSYLPIPIRVPTNEILATTLDLERIILMEDYRCAANIYFQTEGDSYQALIAINKSIELLQNGKTVEAWLEQADLSDRHLPNKFRLKSEILADLGRMEEAVKFAELSLLIAKKVNDSYYINKNLENMSKWNAK